MFKHGGSSGSELTPAKKPLLQMSRIMNQTQPNKNISSRQMKSRNFVGHCVNREGLKPDDNTTDAILKMDDPIDVRRVQRLSGTAGYLAKFPPDISDARESIRRLTNSKVPRQ